MSLKQRNIGLLLVVAGAVLFFGNLGIFHLGNIFVAVILAGAGFMFSREYYKNRKQVWALLVGFGFFATTVAILNPAMAGTFLLATLALGFLLVYKNNSNHWWAIIPAGVLTSLATVAAIEERFTIFSENSAMFFFFGLAATFAYLYFKISKKWAIYPTISLFAIAILASSLSGSWLLPIIFIGAGMYILKSKDINFSNNVTLEADTDE